VIKNGVSVAIVGKPNAGKSTLLNALLQENRAIVSDIAGTTRDTIEEVLNIDGILFRLIDTAGIRESADIIESMGVEKSMEKMRTADLVVYLYDVSVLTSAELESALIMIKQQNPRVVAVGNKLDEADPEKITEKFAGLDSLFISAKTSYHLDLFKQRLYDTVVQGSLNTESAIVTNTRHYQSLQEVSNALVDILNGMNNNLPGDLLALDIRRCLHYLGEITGEITNEDRLDFIFSKFCIGK
jgi:tRNA modification GTPase